MNRSARSPSSRMSLCKADMNTRQPTLSAIELLPSATKPLLYFPMCSLGSDKSCSIDTTVIRLRAWVLFAILGKVELSQFQGDEICSRHTCRIPMAPSSAKQLLLHYNCKLSPRELNFDHIYLPMDRSALNCGTEKIVFVCLFVFFLSHTSAHFKKFIRLVQF